MLAFTHNWFSPPAHPIGVDFGADSLRLAQVELHGNEHRLVAAATVDVPPHTRQDPSARFNFFVGAVRDLLSQGNFRGRRAVLGLPASCMHIQHLRMPRMDDEAMKKALAWEARGKLPIDPSQALLRHIVAGDVYQDQEPKSEVIVMAARRELVDQLLAAASKARLDVIGMSVEPRTLVDCFSHIYRRKTDADLTNCFVDIGCTASRAVIARGGQILFARVIPIGGDHFSRAVASSLKISLDDARLLRIKLCPAAADDARNTMGEEMRRPSTGRADDRRGFSAETQSATAVMEPACAIAESAEGGATVERVRVEQAIREPLSRLIEELALCRRYHDATFPNLPVDRLIFVGGEARHRPLCQQIAREMSLAAQVGDPLVRMGRLSDVGIESGLDRRVPQPGWAVAIGLSMGSPVAQPAAATK